MNLANVADEIQHRIIHIFARDAEVSSLSFCFRVSDSRLKTFLSQGNRACNGGSELLNKDPHFREYVPFHGSFSLFSATAILSH